MKDVPVDLWCLTVRISEKKKYLLTNSDILFTVQTLEVKVMDGPLDNAKLSTGWKRYANGLISDAASSAERVAKACYNMLGDVDLKQISALLRALRVES